MKCIYCDGYHSSILDSRLIEERSSIRRRRVCKKCNGRFTTYEKAAEHHIIVVKRDGTKIVFSEKKLFIALQKALYKRPIPQNTIPDTIIRIKAHFVRKKMTEVRSKDIGLFTMTLLRKIDEVAYLRFRSVYEDFGTLDDFDNAVKEVQKRQDKE